MDMKKMKGLFVVLLLAIFLVGCTTEVTYDQEQVDTLLRGVDTAHKAELQTLSDSADLLAVERTTLEADLSEKETTVAELEAELAELLAVPEEEPEEPEAPYYLIDDVTLVGTFEGVVDNDDLETLFFGEVDYDGEDYDVEEVLSFSAEFRPVLNVEDFGSDVALEIDSDGFSYELLFDDPLLLVEDEDLELTFLGRELTIIEVGNDEITYRVAQKIKLRLGDQYDYKGDLLTLIKFSTGDEDFALLQVNDEFDILKEGDEVRIDGLNVYVDRVISGVEEYNYVTLYVGDDISITVEDRQEFEDDDRYDWIVKSDDEGITSLGVTLVEKYTEEDEVLALGDSLSLPYDYKTVTFDSLRNLEVEDLKVSVRTDEVRVTFEGKIEIDGRKIDDATFVYNGTTVEYEIRSKDLTTEDLSLVTLFVGDRTLTFEANATSFSFGDYEFGYTFGVKAITYAPNVRYEDEDYRFENGDILYQNDANDGDEVETSVTIGFVDTEEEQEVVLRVE